VVLSGYSSYPASSTTKTGHHDIAEILLKVALKHQKSNQPKERGQKDKTFYRKVRIEPHVDQSG